MKAIYDIKEVCPVPPPYGGVTVYVMRLIERLTKDGFSVGGYYSVDCTDQTIIDSPMFDKWTWFQIIYYPFKIWKYLKETRPYKIVHSHFSLEGMLYLWTIMTMGRKKIVITVHNSMSENYLKTTSCVNKFFLKKMLKSPNVTWVAVSDQGKTQLENIEPSLLGRISIVPAYVPLTITEYSPLETSLQNYIDSHEKIISFYGHSFMTNEGVDVYGFQDALKLYSEIAQVDSSVGFVLCLSDTHEDAKIKELHSVATKLGVDNLIFWQIGALENVSSLWHQTDVYIRPTSTDGDSVAVREVLDEGVAVVASNVCWRPKGVITYIKGDNQDFFEKVTIALNRGKQNPNPDYTQYEKMKSIYQKILNERF